MDLQRGNTVTDTKLAPATRQYFKNFDTHSGYIAESSKAGNVAWETQTFGRLYRRDSLDNQHQDGLVILQAQDA